MSKDESESAGKFLWLYFIESKVDWIALEIKNMDLVLHLLGSSVSVASPCIIAVSDHSQGYSLYCNPEETKVKAQNCFCFHACGCAFLCGAFWTLCDREFGDILWEAGALIIAFWLVIIEGSCLLLAEALQLPLELIIHCWTVSKHALKSRFLRGLLASVGVRRDERWA